MSKETVQCPWNKNIVLPEGLQIVVGADCVCPKMCSKYGARAAFCKYKRFTVKKANAVAKSSLDGTPVENLQYNAEEIAEIFPDYVNPISTNQADVNKVHDEIAADIITETSSNQKYVLPIFNAQGNKPKEEQKTEIIMPHNNYEAIELRGDYYTLNGLAGTKKLLDGLCAGKYYKAILETFDIASVFEGDNLRDDFKWVIKNTLSEEKKKRVVEVMQLEGLNREERFFLLFYAAIFYDQLYLPLYWSSEFTPQLRPIYTNAKDFYLKIAEQSDNNFSYTHQKEVLLWLRKISLSDYIQNGDKVADEIGKIQIEIAVNPALDIIVFWDRTKFVYLGKKQDFVKNMLVSDKTLEELEATATFLSKFNLIFQGGQYRVVTRDDNVNEQNFIEIAKEEVNDGISELLFSRGRSLNKINHYLYIVKRYNEMFQPSSFNIGTFKIDREMFTEQIEEIVFKMCEYFFGDAATEAERNKVYNDALLIKLLYNHDIIANAKQNRDTKYMNDILLLVTPNIGKEDTMQKYFEILRGNAKTDEIKLYCYDNSVSRKKISITLRAWMRNKLISAKGLKEICAYIQAPIFKIYQKVFGTFDEDTSLSIEEMFRLYKTEEDNVRTVADSL